MFRKLKLFGFITLMCCSFPVLQFAQLVQLDSLVERAVDHWPKLIQQKTAVEIARAQVEEASRIFKPSISVGGSYTLAAGGRTIDLPLGDLLNPAYNALNQLTGSNQFPQLENASEPLLPNNFYDARLRVVQPILNPQLKLQRAKAAQGQTIAEAQQQITLAELKLAVRSTFFQVLQSLTAEEILIDADTLVTEALRTTSSLVKNGMALPLARERISSERAELRAQLAVASVRTKNAFEQLSYFSGIDQEELRRQLTAVLLEVFPPTLALTSGDRAEFQLVDAVQQVAQLDYQLEKQWRRPQLGVQLDLGSQDFQFGWQPYALAGLSIHVPLYDGGRHSARLQRLELEQTARSLQHRDLENSITLQQRVAANNVESAKERLAAYDPAEAAAARTMYFATKRYKNGDASYLELLDARSQLTRIRLERNLAFYEVWLRHVQHQRALGH